MQTAVGKNRLIGAAQRIVVRLLSLEWQILLVFFCAVLELYASFKIYVFYHPPYGDSDMDFLMARYLLNIPGGTFISSHTPGMALFLILSGVIHLQTWRYFVFLYAMMSLAIPCLTYYLIKPAGRNVAFFAAITVALSAIPFIYARVESYDHLFLFFEFLSFFLVGLYLSEVKKYPRLPYLIACVLFVTNFIKPIAALLFWVFLVIAFIVPGVRRGTLIKAAVCFLSLMAIWVIWDRNYGNAGNAEWSMPASNEQRKFAELYFNGNFPFKEDKNAAPRIHQDAGPASRDLYIHLRKYVDNMESKWIMPPDKLSTNLNIFPYSLFGKYGTDHNALVKAVFTYPNVFYFNFLRDAIQAEYGTRANKVFWDVANEHHHCGLMGWVNYFHRNAKKLITGPQVSMGWRNLLGVFTLAPTRIDKKWNLVSKPYNQTLIHPENGVYSEEFFSQLAFFINELPAFWEHSNSFFEKFSGRPENLFVAMHTLCQSNLPSGYDGLQGFGCTIAEGWYYTMFLNVMGPTYMNALFVNMSIEAFKANPSTWRLFLDNFIYEALALDKLKALGKVILHGETNFLGVLNYLQAISEINFSERSNYSSMISDNLNKELILTIHGTKATSIAGTWYSAAHFFGAIFVFLAFLVLIPAMFSQMRYVALFLMISYLYFISVFAVFGNFGCDRYSDIFILIPVLITAIGFGAFKLFWHRIINLRH